MEDTLGQSFSPVSGNALNYREITLVIGANASLPFSYGFQSIKIIECSDNSALFGALGYATGEITLAEGLGYGLTSAQIDAGQFYNQIAIRNSTAAPVTIRIGFAWGNITDDRVTIGGTVSISGTVVVSSITTPPKDSQAQSFDGSQVSVGTSATLLYAGGSANNIGVTISAGNADLFIDPTNAVTTANGFLIPAGGSFTFPRGMFSAIYGIRSVAGITAYVLTESY